LKYSGKTDIGQKRKNNQDSYTVVCRDGFISAVVCDGMGGAKGGNVASRLAVKAYTQTIKTALAKASFETLTAPEAKLILESAVKKSNSVVFEAANYDMDLEGMGTTLVSALICKNKVYVANVGDSRLYTYRDSRLKQITNDHSFVQYLLDKGSITHEEAKTHPNRNIILRALGVNESVEPDIFEISQSDYEILLLCSDGLTSHLTDEEITELIKDEPDKKRSLRKKTESLVQKANSKSGADNITVVLLKKEPD